MKNEQNQVAELLSTVFEAYEYICEKCRNKEVEKIEASIFEEANVALKVIETYINKNSLFIEITKPPILEKDCFINSKEKDKQFLSLERLNEWLRLAKHTLSKNPIDIAFMENIHYIQNGSVEELFRKIQNHFLKLTIHQKRRIEIFLNRYKYWGSINESQNDFTLLRNRATALYTHSEDFLWLYGKLQDYRSRMVLNAIVLNWSMFDFNMLKNVREQLYKDYFDMDIIQCEEDEVFVDMGAYVGDTVVDFIQTYGFDYKRIYCYEMTPTTFNVLQENLKEFPNIVFRQKGVSDKKGMMYIKEHMNVSSNTLKNEGDFSVETVSIDDDIKEAVTFIKMDIEGAEQSALHGCAKHIRNNKPKLAISVYHNNEDIWKIPRLIEEIMPGYQFYLRYRGGELTPTEISLLAVYPNQ